MKVVVAFLYEMFWEFKGFRHGLFALVFEAFYQYKLLGWRHHVISAVHLLEQRPWEVTFVLLREERPFNM
jgi:hypothetical protein